MIIGIPKEIKNNEFRIGMVPAGVEQLCTLGHKVIVEKSAGLGCGITDEAYRNAGATIASNSRMVFKQAQMIIKVKEILPDEYNLLEQRQIVFTYFHFAADATLAQTLLKKNVVAIAYETVQTSDNRLPLLEPMSEIAGRMAIQEGAKYLEKPYMGKGKLIGGVPGVPPARVVIIGGGTVGANSAKMAAGLNADVVVFDNNINRLRYLDDIMPPNVRTIYSTPHSIRELLKDCDLIVGAVLIVGKAAPKLITKEMLKVVRPGTVFVDVAIDQGGCAETSRATTHDDPVYTIDEVVHYCVANMPGAVPYTSTFALTNSTLPYVIEIATMGYRNAALANKSIANGINMIEGKVTNRNLAECLDLEFFDCQKILC